jgi:hypothetical protein
LITAVDQAGKQVSSTLTVAAQPLGPVSTQPFSASPPSVDTVSGTPLRFALAGGATPYSVSSSQPALVAIRSLIHDAQAARAEVVAEVIGGAGSAIISFTDQAGTLATSSINVLAPVAPPPGPVSSEPLAASPASIVASFGQRVSLTVSGGALPYHVSSSNTAVATKLKQVDDARFASSTIELYITGYSGSCTINIADASGKGLSVPLSVE